MLENDGPDTTLARLLHRTARVEIGTLRRFLHAARRRRTTSRPDPDGPTLGALLVERGLLNEDDLQEHLAALAAAPSSTPPWPAAGRGATRSRRAAPSSSADRTPSRSAASGPTRRRGSTS